MTKIFTVLLAFAGLLFATTAAVAVENDIPCDTRNKVVTKLILENSATLTGSGLDGGVATPYGLVSENSPKAALYELLDGSKRTKDRFWLLKTEPGKPTCVIFASQTGDSYVFTGPDLKNQEAWALVITPRVGKVMVLSGSYWGPAIPASLEIISVPRG